MKIFANGKSTDFSANRIKQNSGLTVLEVIISIAILTVTTAILMRFLVSGDKLYSKSLLIKNAALLANNEAELLKIQGPLVETLEDNEYEKEIGKRAFIVTRKIVEPDSLDSLVNQYNLREIDLQVSDLLRPEKPLVTFKLLQGYNIR